MTDPATEDNPILATIAKKIADTDRFFWDAAVALAVNAISGDYVEFGSWGGNTLRLAHERFTHAGRPRHLWAFDSFAGLPEPTTSLDVHPAFAPSFDTGGIDAFLSACDDHGIPRSDYTVVPGYFEDTLPAIGAGAPLDIALAYVDCNLHSSTLTVLEFLLPRLKHGMILAFDDYFCWSPTDVSGERAAFDERYVDLPQWNFLRYKDPSWGGASFVVEHVGPSAPRRRP